MNILVIEDAPEIVESITLCVSLRWPHSTVVSTGKGGEGVVLAHSEAPNIVILDLALPDIDGFEVLRRIRAFSDVPVAVVTVRGDEISKVKALEMGADDYIVKPFAHTELLARLKALLRRAHMPELRGDEGVVAGRGVQVDLAARRVFVHEQEVELTPTEWNLLAYLLRNQGRIIPQDVLAQKVWGTEYVGKAAIKMCVSRLRRKLGDESQLLIRNHRGRGYSLVIPA